MFGANDTLSRTASALYRLHAFTDPMDDWAVGQCSEVGPLIAKAHRKHELAILAEYSWTSPGAYNLALNQRLATPVLDIDTGKVEWRMSYRVYSLLGVLEVDDVCEECGGALDVKSIPTRAYGGGFDTVTKCAQCGAVEVYV